jgi:hypothetical protein
MIYKYPLWFYAASPLENGRHMEYDQQRRLIM